MEKNVSRTGPSTRLVLACAIPILVVLVAVPRFCRRLSDAVVHLRTDLCDRRTRVQFAARLHGSSFLRSFGLLRPRRLFRRLHGQISRYRLHGGLHPGWAPHHRPRYGGVWLRLRPPHANFLRHPDARAVAGAVDARLQILLGDGRHRRPARCLRQFDAAWRIDRFQRAQRVPVVRAVLLLLRAVSVLHLHGAHVGDRAFAVRQGAAGDPR